jgi:hypothetical protein
VPEEIGDNVAATKHGFESPTGIDRKTSWFGASFEGLALAG